VGVLALVVRVQAATVLPIDHDEPVTLEASMAYAAAWRGEEETSLSGVEVNLEHPGLLKALYGLAMSPLGAERTRIQHLAVGRALSVVFGVAFVVLVARLHLGVGLLLAIHGLHAKYSAEMYLETGAGLAAALGVLFWFRARELPGRWSWLSALCFGVAAASKYVHAIPALVVFGDLLWISRIRRRPRAEPLLFAAVCIGAFFLLNPQVWQHPLDSLVASLSFHPGYAEELQAAGLSRSPWAYWQHLGYPLVQTWHPGMWTLPVEPILALGGLWAFWRGAGRRDPEIRLVGLWFLCVTVFLLAWPTRWPHHAMGALSPLALGLALELRTPARRRYRGV